MSLKSSGLYILKLCGGFSLLWLVTITPGVAQITPDETLSVNSTVTLDGDTLTMIDGGTIAGDNLFHSFAEFSVPTGKTAFFNNSPAIGNIITRVTGNAVSHIDGLIEANGTANLLLINPSGIIFGPNAQLKIGGSFLASTADKIQFADGSFFSATNPEHPPLLTINVPIGLQYGANPGGIINRSSVGNNNGEVVGLQVQPGKTLGLIGGDTRLEGGNLTAKQGRIELGGVGENSFVDLSVSDTGFTLGYDGVATFEDIQLSQNAAVTTSGEGGGNIQVRGRNITLTESSSIVADTLGSLDGSGITITTNNLKIEDGSTVAAATFATGRGGNIAIDASDSVEIVGFGFENFQEVFVGGSLFGTRNLATRENGLFGGGNSTGAAGNILIETAKLILEDGGTITTDTFGSGDAGNLVVRASELVEIIGSSLASATLNTGNAGDIRVETSQLRILDAGFISASTVNNGNGGEVMVKASESVEISGSLPTAIFGTSIVSLTFSGTGASGNIFIDTSRLIVRDGGVISVDTGNQIVPRGGAAGNLTVRASEFLEVAGIGITAPGKIASLLGSRSFSEAPGGEVNIETGKLIVRDGGQISTATFGGGEGGSLVINASDSVELFGTSGEILLDGSSSSGLFASSGSSVFPITSGDGGDLIIDTGELIVRDGAGVAVNSFGSGNAGNIEVMVDFIRLDNQGAITAATQSGKGGNIVLEITDTLVLRNNSLISAEAGGTGNGGNLDINTDLIVAIPDENSDIIANAFEGNGGNINITTQGIFGLEVQGELTPFSDIVASSQFGLDGTIDIQTPDVDPSQGLVKLPSNVVDPSTLISRGCGVGRGATASDLGEFTITGRGGLPTNPNDLLSSDAIVTNPVERNQHRGVQVRPHRFPRNTQRVTTAANSPPKAIVEAQGWIRTPDGRIILTAYPFNTTSNSFWLSHPSCQSSDLVDPKASWQSP